MNVNLTWRRKQKAFAGEQQESAPSTDQKWELYKAVMLAALSGGIDGGNSRDRKIWGSLRQEAEKTDPAFVATLAIYMQEKMHCRELSFFLSATLAVLPGNEEGVIVLAGRLLEQPAWIPEWLNAYADAYGDRHGKRVAKPGRQLGRILSPVFNRIDEFQYTRYNREQQQGFREALLKVRPVAKDRDQRMLFDKIGKDQLPARSTWYEELDAVNRQHYDSVALKRAALKNKWGELILSWRISYRDLLDHLPVILQAGVGGKALQLAAQYIGNAGAVSKNGLLAFRYLQVYRAVRVLAHPLAPAVLEALEKAAVLSAGNIPGFTADTRVLIAMDVSNSMKRAVADDSYVDRFDIAPLLGMSLSFRCPRVTIGLFGNTWKPVGLPGKDILGELDAFQNREGEVGYAANGYEVIRELIRKSQVVDKVLIFTDCRLWDNRQPNQSPGTDIGRLWRQYKQMAPHAQLYLFDLAAYGDNPLEAIPDDVFLVTGWNENVFAVINSLSTISF
ncbi:MAG: hypothetical protein P4L51_21630 [Puia sp.]|nr:hypothetical protein [Puia sp.]